MANIYHATPYGISAEGVYYKMLEEYHDKGAHQQPAHDVDLVTGLLQIALDIVWQRQIAFNIRLCFTADVIKRDNIMPPMTLLGWFHTIFGVVAIGAAVYSLWRYKVISSTTFSGKLYLLVTVFVAGSALAIYNQGGFGIAHVLAVLTLLAVGFGFLVERTRLFRGWSDYFQALGYSSTLLFHMIPAITDFLRRLPAGDPFVDSFTDPLLQGFHVAFLVLFIIGYGAQIVWLRKRDMLV